MAKISSEELKKFKEAVAQRPLSEKVMTLARKLAEGPLAQVVLETATSRTIIVPSEDVLMLAGVYLQVALDEAHEEERKYLLDALRSYHQPKDEDNGRVSGQNAVVEAMFARFNPADAEPLVSPSRKTNQEAANDL